MFSDDTPERASEFSETNYLVSISDLLLGLLFLFILLLVALAFQYKITVDHYYRETESLRNEKERLTGAIRARNGLLLKIQEELNIKSLRGEQAEIDIEKGILRLPEKMLFGSGEARLSPAAKETLEILAVSLSKHLPCYVAENPPEASPCLEKASVQLDTIFIEGHTDRLAISNQAFRNNWELSLWRAKTTYDELLSKTGVLKEFKNENGEPLFTFSAYADTRPIYQGLDPGKLRRNRRIDIRFFVGAPRP